MRFNSLSCSILVIIHTAFSVRDKWNTVGIFKRPSTRAPIQMFVLLAVFYIAYIYCDKFKSTQT